MYYPKPILCPFNMFWSVRFGFFINWISILSNNDPMYRSGFDPRPSFLTFFLFCCCCKINIIMNTIYAKYTIRCCVTLKCKIQCVPAEGLHLAYFISSNWRLRSILLRLFLFFHIIIISLDWVDCIVLKKGVVGLFFND